MSNTKQGFSFKDFFTTLTTKKAILLIVVLGFIVFGNALFNTFVWDDKSYIINDPETHQVNLQKSFVTNMFNFLGQYRPIPATYFSILYVLFGNTSFFYHFLQVTLHIVTTIILYLIFRSIFNQDFTKELNEPKYIDEKEGNSLSNRQKKKYRKMFKRMHIQLLQTSGNPEIITNLLPLFLSLIFLVHPMNIESVSYIAQTVNPLIVIFGLIPLLMLTRKDFSIKNIFMGFSLLLLSLLTKETGIIFLFLAILYSFLFAKKYLGKFLIGAFIILVSYAFFRFIVGKVGFTTRTLAPIASLTLLERFMNMPIIIFYYLKTFFFPLTLAIDQQWTISSISFSSFYFPLIVDFIFFILLGLSGFYIFKHRKNNFKPYVFFTAWFIVGFFFHIQIFPLDMTVTDRWFYIPIIGLLGIFGVIYLSAYHKIKKYGGIAVLLAVVIICSLSLRTIIRNTDWQNAISLYSHDIQVSDNYDLEYDLGREYLETNSYKRALPFYQRSVALRPYEINLRDLGISYKGLGNLPQEKKYLEMALHAKDYTIFQNNKHDFNTYKYYGAYILYNEDPYSAILFIQQALEDYPDSSELWLLMTLAKSELHDRQGTLQVASKAYQLDPNTTDKAIYTHLISGLPFSIRLDGKLFTF